MPRLKHIDGASNDAGSEVRLAVRDLLIKGVAVSRRELGEQFGVGAHVVQLAVAAERGRMEGRAEVTGLSGLDKAELGRRIEELRNLTKRVKTQSSSTVVTVSFAELRFIAYELGETVRALRALFEACG